MEIEFDTDKEATNVLRHKVSLAFGARIFDDVDHLVLPSFRPIDGEDRYKAIGMVDGKLWTAVHVYRGGRVRFISVRRSNAGERRNYDSDPG